MGSKFIWKNQYCLGNESIDSEHKKLFQIANEVFSIKAAEATFHEIEKIIVSLFDYMRYHFDHEEAYMEEIAYSEIDYQKQKHAEIIREMNSMLKNAKDIRAFKFKLSHVIQQWLLVHIIEDDMKIKSSVSTETGEAAPVD